MKLASLTGDSKEEEIIPSLHDSPLHTLVSPEPASLNPSCAVDLTKLEGENIPLLPAEKNQLNGVDNDMHEEDDENFENEGENFDENDDDDADAQGGRFSRGKWTSEEDETLREAVQKHSGRNWKKISDCLEGRTDVQCLHRWQKVLRPGLIKGPWTKEEDDSVCELVGKHGMKSWSFIARQLKGRLGKQCRERWYNHLNPDINRAPWSAEEDAMIVEEHKKKGNKWAEIAKAISGRTDNAIKNRWNSTLQRIILQKSAEWTPKKSKKKVREEGESFGDEPNSSCAKVRRSSSKKKKVKKVAEEEDDDDEHSDANMLLLLSASKPTKGKQKITKNKSPSKKALKLLVKETDTDLDVDECSLSPLKQDLQKQKFKRVMRQFVSSKIVGIAGNSSVALEDGEGEQDLEGEREGMDHIWSPSQQRTPKGKMKASHSQNIGCAYLSPGDEGGDDCNEGNLRTCHLKTGSSSSSSCQALFRAAPTPTPTAHDNEDLPRGKKRSTNVASPQSSALHSFDDYDWVAADAFGKPSKRRKYVTKKTTEHNDAAAVLSLAPLIEVIGSSLDLEAEGEHEGGTTCSSEDAEREWDGDEEVGSTSTETEIVTEPDDIIASSRACPSGRWERRPRAGSDESDDKNTQAAEDVSCSSSLSNVDEKVKMDKEKLEKEEEGMMFFRAELLLTMRTPLLTPIHS